MTGRFAIVGAGAVFTGERHLPDTALVVAEGRVEALVPAADLDEGLERVALDGGLLAPGFVDVQVNGGGGVLFNDRPEAAAIAAICCAHARSGTTALLPTVITDRPAVTAAALEAATDAAADGVPGALGIHIEGPFISVARKGAHDPALIRRMEEGDLQLLLASALRPLLITLAPESVTTDQIRRLAEAGIIVSLGHTDTDFETAGAAFAAGARGATHLFNAMSQLGHRTPGLVGAVLETGEAWSWIIPDGHHVHPAALGAAIRAKRGPARIFATSDAMPTAGSPGDEFTLNGRRARREGGRLTLDDGTLAGSDITMGDALRFLVREMGIERDEALRMCTIDPARFLRVDATHGHLEPGARADMVHLGDDLSARGVWIGGVPQRFD